jgi:integrase
VDGTLAAVKPPALDNPAIAVISSHLEKECRPAEGDVMSSLYQRGTTWWAKAYLNGQAVRFSLRTKDKREARRRLREYDSRPRVELMPARAKSHTWDTAAAELLTNYRVYQTRNPVEAEKTLRTLTRYFHGWQLTDLDTAAIQRYAVHERGKGLAAATVNLRLATLRRALRLAHERGELDKLPLIRMLRPASPRSGFFEPHEFEAVAAHLPPDLELVARLAYTCGWRIDSELLPLTWSQVDLEQGTLRIPPGGSKNRDGRLVYSIPALKDGLAAQRARVLTLELELGCGIPWVFPQLGGGRKGTPRKELRKPWYRACERAGVHRLKHDLRRTAVRDMVNSGIPEQVAMTITGHRTRTVFDRYCIVSPGDLQEAARRLAQTNPRQNGHNSGHSFHS